MKPLVRAMLFTLGEKGYAWIVTDKIDDWEQESIACHGQPGSPAWAEAAFVACTHAFRRLQAQHAELDIVIGMEKCPIGHALPAGLGRLG